MNAIVFVLDGEDWKRSDTDDWSLTSIELDGTEKTVGHKQLDGAICKIVFLDNKYYAISK